MTFENDHLEMMGFKPEHNPAGVYNLVADTVRVAEIKNDPELAYKYGLDKLWFNNKKSTFEDEEHLI